VNRCWLTNACLHFAKARPIQLSEDVDIFIASHQKCVVSPLVLPPAPEQSFCLDQWGRPNTRVTSRHWNGPITSRREAVRNYAPGGRNASGESGQR
jgi:hypothetical protein